MALNQSEDRFNGVVAQLAIKAPCKTVSDAGNILLEGEQTLSGIPVVAFDRVLVIAQTDPIENGIYNVRTSSWERAADWDGNRDITKGTLVTVNRPTNNLTAYVQINLGVGQDNPEIGVDPVAFNIFFSQNNSLDDLSDVDLTGCTDDDLMHFVGGVLVCTLGQLTYDGATLATTGNIQAAGDIEVTGFSNKGPVMRAVESTNAVPTLNPKANEPLTGWGGNAAGQLTGILEDGGVGLRALLMNLPATGHTTRRWNREQITASTTQTQGNGQLTSSVVDVNVVANDNDTVTLIDPQSALDHVVMNRGANILQIFPASGHNLGLGTDNPITVRPGGAIWWVGVTTSRWHIMSVADGSGSVPGAFRGAKVFHSADFTPNDNTVPTWSNGGPPTGSNLAESAVPFNSEVFDTDTIHDTAVNNSRLLTPAGISRVVLKAGITNDEADTGGSHMRFRLNGGFGSIDGVMPNYIPHSTMGSWGSNDANPDIANAGYLHDSGIIEVQNPGTDYYELYLLGQGNGVVFARANKFWFQMEIIE